MTTQQIVDLVRILVWPLALVVLAIVFRQPLSRLIVTVTKLRFRDLEIDFGRELEKLRAKLPAEPGSGLPGSGAESLAADDARATLANDAARAQPLAGVLLAWTELEGKVKVLAERGQADQLPRDLAELIQGLSDLSKAAAGGGLQTGTLTVADAEAFIRLAKRAEAWIDSI